MDGTREQVLAFRLRAQQLDRDAGPLADTAVPFRIPTPRAAVPTS